MKIAYYAIFNYDEYDTAEEKYGISILFPDIPAANSCARNYDEALYMAQDVLKLSITDDSTHRYISMDLLPQPTPIEKIALGRNDQAVLIELDTNDK